MQKAFVIFLIAMLSSVLMLPTVGHAQVKLGAHAGFLLSTIEGTHLDHNRTQPGYHLNAGVQVPLSAKLALEGGVGISQVGVQGNSSDATYYHISLFQFDYPLWLVLNLKPNYPTLRFGLINSHVGAARQHTAETTTDISQYVANWNHRLSFMMSMPVYEGLHAGLGVSSGINNIINIAAVNQSGANTELLMAFRNDDPGGSPGAPYATTMRVHTFCFWLTASYFIDFKDLMRGL